MPVEDNTHQTPMRSNVSVCLHDGPKHPCDRPLHAKGYCQMHYRRHKDGREMDAPNRLEGTRRTGRNKGKTCKHDGPKYPCDRKAIAKGYCPMHYTRHKEGREMDAPVQSINKGRICMHDGPKYPCDRPAKHKGYCDMHYKRILHGRKMDGPPKSGRVLGSKRNNGDGYILLKTGFGRNGWELEHRYVMEQKLGRPLLKTEQVHHRNGIPDDNRPENLQLVHTAKHRQGQSVADILAYAYEMIALYETPYKKHPELFD